MKNQSLWTYNIKSDIQPSLDKDIKVDVLIIGGGLTGISSAYHLKDDKLKTILIEQDRVGYGVSSRTTGKLTFLQGLIYHKLERNFNYEISKLYLDSQKYAIDLVLDIIKKNNIDCNLTKSMSYVFTNNDNEIKKFKNEAKFFRKANIKYYINKNLPINYPCKYSISVDDTYVFHPLKYILELKKICLKSGIKIYENTRALKLDKKDNYYICYTDKFKIKAKKVIISTHYPFFVIPGFIPLKTHIEKSYISASIIDKDKKFNAITNTYPIKSIRYHKENTNEKYVLFTGESHKLCNNLNRKEQYKKLLEATEQNLSKNIKFIWTNQDIMTNDNLPFIGAINKNNPNLLIATGYNTWGMTNASLAGKILSDNIKGNKNKYARQFNPCRPINIDKIKNFVLNSYFNGKAYILTKTKKNYFWYKNIVKFENRNGINVGIYIDDKGIEHIVKNLCPHMKCSLIFNMEDKTWDCPCHGSRFDIDGKVIEGPSVYNIKINNYKKNHKSTNNKN